MSRSFRASAIWVSRAIANALIDFVSGAEGLVLLAIVLGIVFAESAVLLDFFVPGEVGLVVAGAVAAQNGTPLPGVIAAAAIGAFAGDSVGYLIGRRFGPGVAEHGRLARWLGPALRRAREHFDRRGGATIALARFVGALRAVVPVVAGSAGMSYRRFALWALPAAVAWSALMASVGFVWGDDIADVIDRIGLLVSAVVVLVVVALLVRAYRRRKAEGTGGDRTGDQPTENDENDENADDAAGPGRWSSRAGSAPPREADRHAVTRHADRHAVTRRADQHAVTTAPIRTR